MALDLPTVPIPSQYPTLDEWAEAFTVAMSELNVVLSGNIGTLILPIFDTTGRVIVDEDGVTAYNDFDLSVPISPGTVQIDTNDLVNASITTSKLGALSVDSTKLAALAVIAGKIATGAVTEGTIDSGAVTATKIANLAVGTAAIQAAAVGTAQIANAAITSALIGNLQVLTAAIDDLAVNEAKIANLAVGSAKIQNAAITNAKINDLAVNAAKIANATITTAKIANAQITQALIANLAVGTAQIIDANITTAKINNLAVTSAKILSLDAVKIQAATITADKYLELRNSQQLTHQDSLDSSKPMDMDFVISSELNTIIKIRLSFKIKNYRAYSTTDVSGGGQTSTDNQGVFHDHQVTVRFNSNSEPDIYFDPPNRRLVSTGATYSTTLDTREGHVHTITVTNVGSISGLPQMRMDNDTGTFYCAGGGAFFTSTVNNHNQQIPILDNLGVTSGLVTIQRDSNSSFLCQTKNAGSGTFETFTNRSHDEHTHDVSDHQHGLTYGIHEETNSPTITVRADNGSGFGGVIITSTVDKLEQDITGNFSGSGFKALRFEATTRCRVHALLEIKLDIDA